VTQQLDLVARIPCSADHFTIEGDRLYAGARYGDAHAMTIVDLADVTAPRALGTLACRRQVPSVAVAGQVAFVGEYRRSILAVDVRDPAKPKPFDAVVSFQRELGHFEIHGGLLVAAAAERGVFALDVRDPWKMRRLPALAIAGKTKDEQPDVEQLTSRDGLIYAAVRHVGCVIVELAGGELRERGRITPEDYNPSHVLATERCLWLFGHGEEDSAGLIVFERATGKLLYRGPCAISNPHNLVDIPGGALGLHTHYTGSVFHDADARIEQLFRQYEADDDKSYIETHFAPKQRDDGDDDDGDDGDDDDGPSEVYDDRRRSCMDTVDWIARHRGHLVAVHGLKELIVWKPRAGSVLG
jgi:hypothetical protein